MSWKTRILAAFAGLAMATLAGCAGRPDLDDTNLSGRDLELERYFDGNLVAYGQFQDLFGTVRERFKVEINGTWDGETLTLVEDFVYDDGRTEQRVWTLEKTGEETWSGTADGVQGTALGTERGDTFNWAYTIDLPLADGSTQRLKFDDWMWLMADGRLLNRAYVSRFGVTVGDVIIMFEKRD